MKECYLFYLLSLFEEMIMAKVQAQLTGAMKQVFLDQLVTQEDLQQIKTEILIGVKQVIENQSHQPTRKWLKSYEVEKLLGISSNTLQTWRNNGLLPYSPLGGIYYYDPADIEALLQARKQSK